MALMIGRTIGNIISGAGRAILSAPQSIIGKNGRNTQSIAQGAALAIAQKVYARKLDRMQNDALQEIKDWLSSGPSIGVIILVVIPWVLNRFGLGKKTADDPLVQG